MTLLCPVCLLYIDDVLEQEDAEEDPLENIVISCPHCKVKLEFDHIGGFLETRYFLKEKVKYELSKSNVGRTVTEMVL